MDKIKKLKTSELKVCEQYMLDTETYEQEYGFESVVFTQVGDFYEMYSAIMGNGEELYYQKMLDICQKCSMSNSLKQKVKIAKDPSSSVYMAGFPLHALDKFLNLMVDTYEWTVVLVNQEKKYIAGKTEVKRVVSGVFSPGTNFTVNKDSNVLVCIYLELQKSRFSKFGKILYCGLSQLDCITGKSSVKEIWNHYESINMIIDDIRKFICVHNPKEVIIYHKNMDDLFDSNDIITNIGALNRCHNIYDKLPDKCYNDIVYQEATLTKFFNPNLGDEKKLKTKLTIFQYLGLDMKQFARMSYILLLNYIWNRLPNIVERLENPEIQENELYLTLANDSLEQLKVVHEGGFFKRQQMTLLSLLDNAVTAVGRRTLRFRLLNPIRNINVLEKRYMQIEIMMDRNKKGVAQKTLINNIQQKLVHILDLERLSRRMGTLNMSPNEFVTLDRTCKSINNLINYINKLPKTKSIIKDLIPSTKKMEKYKEFMDYYESQIDLKLCNEFNNMNDIDRNIFKKGINTELDSIQQDFDSDNNILSELKDTLTHLIKSHTIYQEKAKKGQGHKTDIIKQAYNDQYKHHLYCSPTNSKILKNALEELPKSHYIKIGKFKIKSNDINFDYVSKQKVMLKIPCIAQSNITMVTTGYLLKTNVKNEYIKFLGYTYKKYNTILQDMAKFIGEIDVIRSCCLTAINNNYKQPTIDIEYENSFIETTNIRHPLIEKINTKSPYIPHSITIGKEDTNGILLFGANASGKSACMKSIGLNLIMAQAGMYVAADSFVYHPYDYLFTRIQGNDDIQRSKSSFEVEMSELKTIMDNVDNHSIILGDELCRGTENISGTAIVSAGIIKLAKKDSSFIFATHLHGLNDIEEVKQLHNVKFKHLTVKYDAERNKLIYDRKIKDGVGATIYGLEVCKALAIDEEFLDLANTIRKRIIKQGDNIQEIKVSNYGNKVYQNTCAICDGEGEHVHHIKFQSEADENNIISSINAHKNVAYNQVWLCQKCHVKVHNNEINIKGYIDTSHGVELDYIINV